MLKIDSLVIEKQINNIIKKRLPQPVILIHSFMASFKDFSEVILHDKDSKFKGRTHQI